MLFQFIKFWSNLLGSNRCIANATFFKNSEIEPKGWDKEARKNDMQKISNNVGKSKHDQLENNDNNYDFIIGCFLKSKIELYYWTNIHVEQEQSNKS